MTSLNISGTALHIARDLRTTQPGLLRAATVSALTRANAKVFTETKREIRSETGIPLKHFKGQLKKYPANKRRLRARTWMGLRTRISLGQVNAGKKISGKWANLIDPETADPAHAFKREGGGRAKFFVRAPGAAGASGRDSKGRPRKQRLPVRELKLDIVKPAQRAVRRAGTRYAGPVFVQRLRHEIQRRQRKVRTR